MNLKMEAYERSQWLIGFMRPSSGPGTEGLVDLRQEIVTAQCSDDAIALARTAANLGQEWRVRWVRRRPKPSAFRRWRKRRRIGR